MDPSSLKTVERASALQRSGENKQALSLLHSLLDSLEDCVDRAYVSLAVADCLKSLGNMQEAKETLLAAAERLPSKTLPRLDLEYALACIYWDEQEFKKANSMLDRILFESRKFVHLPEGAGLYRDVLVRHGILVAERQEPQQACRELEEALSLGIPPEHTGIVLFNLGVSYYLTDDYGRAKDKLLAALAAGLERYCELRAHYYLGLVHLRNGSLAWAKRELEYCLPSAVQANIDERDLLRTLALVCEGLGLAQEAETYKRQAV